MIPILQVEVFLELAVVDPPSDQAADIADYSKALRERLQSALMTDEGGAHVTVREDDVRLRLDTIAISSASLYSHKSPSGRPQGRPWQR